MLRPELTADARFASMEQRYANRRELDREIAAWTADIEPTWLMGRLQRAGIPADGESIQWKKPRARSCSSCEDNEYVYRELLGFSEEQYRRFEELGHIGADYDPSVP